MGLALPGFPTYPQHTITVTLGGAQFVFTLTWRERNAAWYADIRAVDGTDLVLGVALRPGWAPLRGLVDPGLPSGVIYVRGPNDYARSDLGVGLRIMQYNDDEIPSAPDDGIVARIP